MKAERTLIVTADDFGASIAVNDAVERGHRDGILTCASLMVAEPAAADAVARARTMPALGVGLHVVLAEGRPVLPPDAVPGLVDTTGHFPPNMISSAFAIAFRPAVRRQLAAEIEAQFAAFAATGLAFDHVNAHKHFHLHPVIADLIVKTARRYGVRAVRAPVEPRAVLARVESAGPSRLLLAHWWASRIRRQLRRGGMVTTERVFGLAWSGAMDTHRVRGLIAALPAGTTEIYTHPATRDDWTGHAPGYRYTEELAALLDARALVLEQGITLARFADLPLDALAR